MPEGESQYGLVFVVESEEPSLMILGLDWFVRVSPLTTTKEIIRKADTTTACTTAVPEEAMDEERERRARLEIFE